MLKASKDAESTENRLQSAKLWWGDGELASFTTTHHPATNPRLWLHANTEHISDIVRNHAAIDDCDREDYLSFVANIGMYPRLSLYTLLHLKRCGGNINGLDGFKEALKTWAQPINSVDSDIAIVLSHKTVSDFLLSQLKSCKTSPFHSHPCDSGRFVSELLMLDIQAIGACIASIIVDCENRKTLFAQGGETAQSLLNLLQALSDYLEPRSKLRRSIALATVRLSRSAGLYPACLVLDGLQISGDYPVALGSFGDVWKGSVEGHLIAIKVLRVLQTSSQKHLKEFSHEAVLWRQLLHPNVLPFYGIFHMKNDGIRPGLVSPWMENGNIVQYLERNDDADRFSLVLDIAHGLEYLHSENIVHCDLKGVNVLITQSHRACLADFGLASTRDFRFMDTPTSRSKRSLRWQAPELLDWKSDNVHNTTESDMYAFGLVCYEVFAGKIPYYNINNETHIMMAIMTGVRPPRPPPYLCISHGLHDTMWGILEACWKKRPQDRPTAGDILESLSLLRRSNVGEPPANNWDFVSRLRSGLANEFPVVADLATAYLAVPSNRSLEYKQDCVGPAALHSQVSDSHRSLTPASESEKHGNRETKEHALRELSLDIARSKESHFGELRKVKDTTVPAMSHALSQVDLHSLFVGHTKPVTCVAFSQDGSRVASSSDDFTIRVWDINTGHAVSRPFRGHNNSVSSIVFSLDGSRIISGSADKTIRVWDTMTGNVLSKPFKGHTDMITSIALSPDGERVASGSYDTTIRVWDVVTGMELLQPFSGHANTVSSVMFSPDGRRIVSGSYDNAICVWDAATGDIISGPLIGHTDIVTSVAFSPDGARIVSGSYDRTVRVWDAATGDVLSALFEFKEYTNMITSVAFSSDGSFIASGAYGGTIRVCNAHSGAMVLGPFTGHSFTVSSIAFSLDGARIVSGSYDSIVCIWDLPDL